MENKRYVALLSSLNRHHPTIKFTATWSAEKVDVFGHNGSTLKDGQISTNLYTKPMDKHWYLRMDTCHPFNCKSSIPYTQAAPPLMNLFEGEKCSEKN